MPLRSLVNLLRRANARRGDIARALAEDSRRSFWAAADQGVVSLGNFAVIMILGSAFERIHAVGQYGDFWTLMELMLFLNSVQASLVVYPLTVRAAASESDSHGRLTGMSMLLTMLAWPLAAVSMLITARVAHISLTIGLWAGIAMLLWQVQETTRRALLAKFRFRSAIVGDAVSYLGQIAGIVALSLVNRLTLATTFQVMALTSAAAALIQSAQIRLHGFKRNDLNEFARECWNLGRWAVAGSATNFVSPIYSWNMRYWLGVDLQGINYNLTNLLRLTNPLSSVMASLITPHAARDMHENGIRRAKIQFLRYLALGMLFLTPYLGLLIIFPKPLLGAVYSRDSVYIAHSAVLQISALGAGLIFLVIATGAFLNGVRQARLVFVGQIIGAVLVLAIGIPLMARYGLIGAALGGVVSALVQCLINAYCVVRVQGTAAGQTPHPKMESTIA